MKFTLISENEYSNTKNTLEFNCDRVEKVVENFEQFLKGSGYVFDGSLDIVSDEDRYGRNLNDNSGLIYLSDFNYDTISSFYFDDTLQSINLNDTMAGPWEFNIDQTTHPFSSEK